jgi:hypothetical protein
VQNIASGAGDSNPAGFTLVAGNVYFSATDDTTGNEFWSLPVATLNYAPVSSGQAITTTANTAASGVLGASDGDGDALIFSIVANGSKGTAVITNAATGAFTYTPKPGASGSDSFTFKASDWLGDSNVATVQITISADSGYQVYMPLIRD